MLGSKCKAIDGRFVPHAFSQVCYYWWSVMHKRFPWVWQKPLASVSPALVSALPHPPSCRFPNWATRLLYCAWNPTFPPKAPPRGGVLTVDPWQFNPLQFAGQHHAGQPRIGVRKCQRAVSDMPLKCPCARISTLISRYSRPNMGTRDLQNGQSFHPLPKRRTAVPQRPQAACQESLPRHFPCAPPHNPR